MGLSRRTWLLAPAAGLCAADVGLTLAGQPAEYWAGDYATAVEVNPVAYALLAVGPGVFVAFAVCWLAVLAAVVLRWPHPLGGWLAVGVAIVHAIGGSSWLAHSGGWGLVAASVYLAVAAQASTWCWRQYARA